MNLAEESNVQINATLQIRTDLVTLYSLDAILSVGYRVNSRRGTEFRIWATNVLRDHIVRGYTVNQHRLSEQAERYRELQDAVRLIGEVLSRKELDSVQTDGLLRVITDYAHALSVLDDYDHQSLSMGSVTRKSTSSIAKTYRRRRFPDRYLAAIGISSRRASSMSPTALSRPFGLRQASEIACS